MVASISNFLQKIDEVRERSELLRCVFNYQYDSKEGNERKAIASRIKEKVKNWRNKLTLEMSGLLNLNQFIQMHKKELNENIKSLTELEKVCLVKNDFILKKQHFKKRTMGAKVANSITGAKEYPYKYKLDFLKDFIKNALILSLGKQENNTIMQKQVCFGIRKKIKLFPMTVMQKEDELEVTKYLIKKAVEGKLFCLSQDGEERTLTLYAHHLPLNLQSLHAYEDEAEVTDDNDVKNKKEAREVSREGTGHALISSPLSAVKPPSIHPKHAAERTQQLLLSPAALSPSGGNAAAAPVATAAPQGILLWGDAKKFLG